MPMDHVVIPPDSAASVLAGIRAVPDFLAERVARDRALALDWLLAEVRLLPELQRTRAAHALGLARGQPAAGAASRLTELDGQLKPGPDGCPGPQSGDSHPG